MLPLASRKMLTGALVRLYMVCPTIRNATLRCASSLRNVTLPSCTTRGVDDAALISMSPEIYAPIKLINCTVEGTVTPVLQLYVCCLKTMTGWPELKAACTEG